MPLVGLNETITVQRRTAPVTNAEGQTSMSLVPHEVDGCYAAMVNFQEQTLAAERGMRLDAVVAMPLGADVDGADLIDIEDVHGPLGGRYEVVAIRQTAIHLRVLCRRYGRS